MVKLPFKLLLMSYLFPAYMWPIYAHLWGRQNFYFHCHDLSLRRCYNHLSTRQGTGSWSRCVTCVDIAAHHRAVQLLTVSSLSSSNVAPPLYVVPPSVFLALVLIRCFFFFLRYLSPPFMSSAGPWRELQVTASAEEKRESLFKNEEGKTSVKFAQAIFLTNWLSG